MELDLASRFHSGPEFSMRQMWECLHCRAWRQWGFGLPDDTNRTPVLNCSSCNDTAYHRYAGLETRGRR